MNAENVNALFKKIPSGDRLLSSPEIRKVLSAYPRSLVLRAIHGVLDEIRGRIQAGDFSPDGDIPDVQHIVGRVMNQIRTMGRSHLRPVINGTGVIIHTNLGRSVLGERVLSKFRPLSGGYSNLEYDLEKGKRGSRYSHVEGILKELTSAEAALVVNNNAAAVLIALETLARGREVIVSRGELVEIGGSFRIPDVMRKSGAAMIEVGTTNKTHLSDYEEKIGPETGMLLRVHQSNFKIVGFTESVGTKDLVALGVKYDIPVMEDLGSGCLIDFSRYGLAHEPTVLEVLAQGVDLVTFSGDKLLGGPQAGIILGKRGLVEAIRNNPLNRALRIDKLTLLALEETLNIYRDEREAIEEVPTLEMICKPFSEIKTKAERLVHLIGKPTDQNFTIRLSEGQSKIGGGALPLMELPSLLISLMPNAMSAQDMERRLRSFDPPIITRVEKDEVMLDLRTIQEKEMKTVALAIREMAEGQVDNSPNKH